MGAAGWSKLGEDVCSELEIFILLPPSDLSVSWEEKSDWNRAVGFGKIRRQNPKLKSRDDPLQTKQSVAAASVF